MKNPSLEGWGWSTFVLRWSKPSSPAFQRFTINTNVNKIIKISRCWQRPTLNEATTILLHHAPAAASQLKLSIMFFLRITAVLWSVQKILYTPLHSYSKTNENLMKNMERCFNCEAYVKFATIGLRTLLVYRSRKAQERWIKQWGVPSGICFERSAPAWKLCLNIWFYLDPIRIM